MSPSLQSEQPAGAWRARIAAAEPAAQAELLREAAREVRRRILRAIGRAGAGHVGGDFSVADILTVLFLGVLRLDPSQPHWPERDRMILSKGHCSAALYAVMATAGFFDPAELDSFMAPLARLNGHPNRKIPGVEANTGPLGHGLPIAVGSAIAARIAGASWRSFVVLGDGELQEGSNWEAAMAAGHRGLGTLTAIIDRNRLQQGARTEDTNRLEPLADKWRAFGWAVSELDGHDIPALLALLRAEPPPEGPPRCVIAHTKKGRGASFMEDRVEWHHKVPSAEQIALALAEIDAA